MRPNSSEGKQEQLNDIETWNDDDDDNDNDEDDDDDDNNDDNNDDDGGGGVGDDRDKKIGSAEKFVVTQLILRPASADSF